MVKERYVVIRSQTCTMCDDQGEISCHIKLVPVAFGMVLDKNDDDDDIRRPLLLLNLHKRSRYCAPYDSSSA